MGRAMSDVMPMPPAEPSDPRDEQWPDAPDTTKRVSSVVDSFRAVNKAGSSRTGYLALRVLNRPFFGTYCGIMTSDSPSWYAPCCCQYLPASYSTKHSLVRGFGKMIDTSPSSASSPFVGSPPILPSPNMGPSSLQFAA